MLDVVGVVAREDHTLLLDFENGEHRVFDMKPFLESEAFEELKDIGLFLQVRNGGYFVEWPTGADLSADTLCLEGTAA